MSPFYIVHLKSLLKKCIVINVYIYFYDNLIYKTIIICTCDMHIVFFFFKGAKNDVFQFLPFQGAFFIWIWLVYVSRVWAFFFKEQIWVMSPYASDMDPLLRLKKRSIVCLRQYLCVDYWNMTFLLNCPFMSTLIELIGFLLHSFSGFITIHRWEVVKLYLP